MPEYVFRGPGPVHDDQGGITRPLDVRDFEEAPDCPPWELVGQPEAAAGGVEGTPPPSAPVTPPAARTPKGGK